MRKHLITQCNAGLSRAKLLLLASRLVTP